MDGSKQPLVGAYINGDLPQDMEHLKTMESWLGRKLDYAVQFTGAASWQDFDGSVQWALEQFPNHEKLLLSVPLIPNGADLGTAATGAYNDHYRMAAEKIAAYDPNAIIRVGWEMNGDWYPWKAAANPEGYVKAFQEFVDTFRSVSPDFKFDWCPNIGTMSIDPEKVYPGDKYVDFIGLDVYEDTQWTAGKTPDERWGWIMNQPHGLKWQAEFAAAHGKEMSYPEYASNYNDGSFVSRMAEWIKENDVAYHSWWNAHAAFDGDLQSHPQNLDAFKEAWGPGSTPATGPADGGSGTSGDGAPTDAGNSDPGSTIDPAHAGDAADAATPPASDAQQHAGDAGGGTSSGTSGHTDHTGSGASDAAGSDPAQSSDPTHGADPAQGSEPAQGADPAQPADPAQGAEPVQGSDPAQGSHPTDPAQSGDGAGSETPGANDPQQAAEDGGGDAGAVDPLVLHLSGDAYEGNPQVTVTVDGQVVGTYEITASHATHEWQAVTIGGDFSANAPHQVEIAFTNDLWDGTPQTDRNVYLQGVEFDGQHLEGSAAANSAGDPNDGTVAQLWHNGVLSLGTSAAESGTSAAPAPTDTGAVSDGASGATGIPPTHFSDGAGHDLFVFNSLDGSGTVLDDFQPGVDILDLAPLMKAIGYEGSDPVADHIVAAAATEGGGTVITVDPTGQDPAHGTAVVTLENVLPQQIHTSDIWLQ